MLFLLSLLVLLLFLCLFYVFSEIPQKQMREWKELLLHGLPFYESTDEQQQQPEQEQELSSDLVELAKQDILNNQDYDEYTVSCAQMLVSLLAAASPEALCSFWTRSQTF